MTEYITKEQAEKIANQYKGFDADGLKHIYAIALDDFYAALNRAINLAFEQRLEVVQWRVSDRLTGVELIVTNQKDVADSYELAHPDNVVTPLYALKESLQAAPVSSHPTGALKGDSK
jgi:hypothetical protein